ncbi:MAG: NAD-dependent epimerase/dehydratase family protein [Deltaproteobacteria bacterium]|nr:NAD-dependent epimerase/dehydratase family protein [Deltaproteobacteria bacterium]MBW2445706.1 NAD-dependent epimerase/dehydratase family protein [Deltaproteobacteria bacterium]
MDAPHAVGITGLGTFLGQRLAERLSARGIRVVGLDVRRPYRIAEKIQFQRIDLTEPTADAALAELLARERVDTVVHAAFRAEPTADVEADHELETIGSLHVLNGCAAAKVRRLVFASSTMLYGPWPDNPNFLSEDHPLRGHPDAHQVQDRVEAESLLARFGRLHPDVELTVLRTCWIMGPSYLDHVVNYFERPVVATLLGYDPLLQFVHEEDAVRAFERATLEPHPGVYNVVGKGVWPLSTLLRLAGKRSLALPAPLLYRMGEYPSKAQTGDAPSGFYDYLRYLWVADGERGWAALGEPEYSTKEAWIAFVGSRRMRRYR